MKLRKWIAGATCACMLLTLSPPAAVLAETMPQAATHAAARATIGDFNVTGGTSGTDYSFENDTLIIKSGKHLTIKTNATTAQRIKVAPNVQANITLAGVHIQVPNDVEAPAMDLHEAGASTINLAADTTNTLDASRTEDLGAGLRTTKKGFVTINGPGTLIAKGGKKWPGIGGFAGDQKPGDVYTGEANIRITGGTIEASTENSPSTGKKTAAAIGGSSQQGYTNIQITGGTVTADGDIGPSPTVDTEAEFGTLTVANAVVQVMSDTITRSKRHFSDCIVGRNLVEYTVYGNWTISEDVTIPQGKWLNVESGGCLTIGGKATLTNEGGIHVWQNATISADGALVRAGKGQYQVESGGKILNNTPPENYGYTIVGNMVNAKPGYEISFNQSNWSNSEEFKTNITYYIRKAGDLPTFGPSGVETFSFSESNRLPPPTVTIDYVNETLSTDESMEYDTRLIDAPWPTCPKNMPLSKLNDMHGWKNGQYEGGVEIRTKARDGFIQSNAVSVTIPARPTAPTVGFSYKDGTIGTVNTMEYRMSDNEGWTSCNGDLTILDEWFGKTMQIRTKAVQGQKFASFVQKLSIPAREVLTLTIDTAKEGVTVPSGYRYKVGSAQNWSDGTGKLVTVAPGQSIEIVKPSTNSSFQSEVLMLVAPTRGTHQNVAFNYANESVNTTTAMEYRVDGGAWTTCTANMTVKEAWFGKNVEFRTKATAKNYASEAQTLNVPARNQAPTVTIDYSAETLGTTAAMEYRVGNGQWNDCTANMSAEAWFGKDVQFRIKSTNNAFASETQTLSIAARPEAPSLELDNATEAVTISADYYYNTESAQYDNGKWKQGDGSAVQVGAEKTIYIYKVATKNAFKSQVQTLTAPSKGDIPNVTTDFDEEILSTTTAMEYRLENGAWKDCSADMKVTEFGWNGTADLAVEFRTKATDKNYASDVQNVTIAKRPAVPEGVTPTHVSVVGRKDGALNGVSTDMEYKLATAADWTPCNGTEVSGLAAGTYEVRVKATKQAFASEAVAVTINKGAQLVVSAVDLGEAAYGYTPAAKTITITNSGDGDATIESVAVSKDSHFEVAGAGTTVTAGGTVTTYTIQPKAGWNAAVEKPYTDTITVTYNNGATATADVAFTVTKADPVVTAPAANDLTYNRGEQALVTAGTTNGGTLEYRLSEDGTYSNAVPKATNAGSYTVYYRVVGDSNFNSAVEQSLSVTIQKAPQVVPAAPEAENVTLYAITLKTVADANGVKAEYGIKDNDGNYQWQETPLFENLSSGTSYTFKVRYVESANYLGAESAEAVIHTNSRPTYPPIVPEVEGGEVIIKPSRPTSGQTVIITPKPNEGMEVDKVEVTDKNGNQIEVTQKPNGDFTFKQPSGKVTITVTFKPAVPSDFPFIDVPEDAWYRGAVEYVYNNSLIMGVAPNLFAPNMTTDRGQLVTMLWRLAGEPQAENSTDFGDVPSSAYYAKAVAWAAENGITAGFEDGTFRPTTGLSREQMAALFMKYAQAMGLDTSARADISGFTDINSDSWSYDALSWAKAVGLLNGVGDATMAPQDTATRAQIAAVLQRYCETIAK